MKKRLLSLFLVICMCISFLPAPASAAATEPPEFWEISVPVPFYGDLIYQNDSMNSYFTVTCPKDCGYTVTRIEWLGYANGYWFTPGRIIEDITEIRLYVDLEFTEPPEFNTDYLTDIPLKVHFQDKYAAATTYTMSEANRIYSGPTEKPNQWTISNHSPTNDPEPSGVTIELHMVPGVIPDQPEAPPIIRFDRGQHAQGFMDPQFANEDGSFLLPDSEFYPDRGYVFMRWDLGNPGETIYVTENTRLFAQWGSGIMFYANGGEGTMETVYLPLGSTYVLPECEFTPPEGKVFDQWNLGPVGTEIVVEGGTITLEAQWKDATSEPVITTATVTANIVGGQWSDRTTAPKTIEVTLTDGNGVLPHAELPTGMTKLDGYTETGLWHKTLPNGDLADCPELNHGNDLAITGDMTVSYVFETLPVFEASPKSLSGGGEVTITCSRSKLTCDDSSIVIGEPVQDGDTYVRTITLPNKTKTYTFSTETESHLQLQLQVRVTEQHIHQMTHHPEVSVTCTENGVREHWHCTGCNKNFADEAGTQELTDLVIPATGHAWNTATYEWSEDGKTCTAKRICQNNPDHFETAPATVTSAVAKQPTETEMGQTTYTAAFDVDWAETQTKTLTDIPVKEHVHTLEHRAEVPALCEENGVKEHWHCTGCDKNFADEAGTRELTDLVIAAKGHTFGEPFDLWTEGMKVCTRTWTCAECEETREESVDATSEVVKEPTCTETGIMRYTAAFSEGPNATKEVAIAAKGHAYGDPTFEWSFNNEAQTMTCEARQICANDAGHVLITPLTVTEEDGVFTAASEDRTLTDSHRHDFTNGDCSCGAVEPAPEVQHSIPVEFVKKSWFSEKVSRMTVEPNGTVTAPDANGFFQSGNGWMSENGRLYVASKGTVTYAQLLEVLGGPAQEGAVVRFTAVREQDVPPTDPADPQTQTVTVHFMENGQQIGGDVQVTIPSDRSFVTAAQVAEHLPKGYDFAEAGQDYTIINGVAEVPVKAVEIVEPTGKPITVTFKLGGWGSRLEGTRSKTMTVTLEPGQSVKAPFAVMGFFGRTKSVVWQSSTGLQVTSGDMVSHETLAQMLGDSTSITFTGK